MAQKPPPVWEQRDAETAEAYSTPPKMPVTLGVPGMCGSVPCLRDAPACRGRSPNIR
ncbi:hypothetical protein J7S19_05410 [Corynebacterium pyruviciproducens]|uniref:hypothetical protein n=1 Tax=Corynebacterium pyruviciproducens TaxID=598660 RepID=UPI002455EE96|nr:hypothetical protein [Corynebacterium pyruviciproducens]MDH4658050.1 hypothetical protein [Corynebacterium pyruviciproducens]